MSTNFESGALWPHQAREVADHGYDKARFLAWDPRTGKTRTILEEALLWGGNILVVCPKTAALTWFDELGMRGLSYTDLVSGSLEDRARLLEMPVRAGVLPNLHFAIVNYDALYALEKVILKYFPPKAVVFDEAHKIKSPGSKRTRASNRIAEKARYTRALTGTPTPKDYRDLYSQCKALDGGALFGVRVRDFEARYCNIEWIGGRYPKLVGYRNLDELRRKWNSIASRVTEKDAFGIQPTPRTLVRHVEFSPAQSERYYQLTRNFILDGVRHPHILARLSTAQQLTWPVKVEMVVADVEASAEAGQKTVVFYQYVEEGQAIFEAIKDTSVARIGGDTSLKLRGELLDRFNNGPFNCLVVQQQAMGEGVPIHADAAIFPSPDANFATHFQCQKRIFVPGKQPTYIYPMVPHTVDGFFMSILSRKSDAHTALLDTPISEVFGNG